MRKGSKKQKAVPVPPTPVAPTPGLLSGIAEGLAVLHAEVKAQTALLGKVVEQLTLVHAAVTGQSGVLSALLAAKEATPRRGRPPKAVEIDVASKEGAAYDQGTGARLHNVVVPDADPPGVPLDVPQEAAQEPAPATPKPTPAPTPSPTFVEASKAIRPVLEKANAPAQHPVAPPTLDELKTAFLDYIAKHGREAGVGKLKAFGAANLSTVPPASYGSFRDSLRA